VEVEVAEDQPVAQIAAVQKKEPITEEEDPLIKKKIKFPHI
jgi:hypothetical protein